jgi:ribose transport system permease protein
MKSTASNAATVSEPALFTPRAARRTISSTFVRVGVLPLILLAAIVVFSLLSNNFLTPRNLTNVFRQSVFLTIVSLGQMMVLLTGGFDLSVGHHHRADLRCRRHGNGGRRRRDA